MRSAIVLVISLFGSVSTMPVMATPYVLKCTTEVELEGYQPTLTVDLDNREMNWGGIKYLITGITDKYITGVDTDDPVGAEVIVLNRVSGEYQRASIGLFCKSPPPNCHANTVIRASTTTGKCVRPIL